MKFRGILRKLTAIALLGLSVATGSAQAQTNNVQALLEGELLIVRGDALANAITLSRNTAGEVLVVGRAGTTVNGQASVRFRRAVLNSVEVLLFGGNDNVIINNLVINNDLFLNLGSGNDTFRSGGLPTVVGANLTVEGGSGNDVVRLTGWTVGTDVYVNGQTGTLNSQMTGLRAGFAITVIGDDGRDIVSLNGCTTGDFTSIETKKGNDSVTVGGLVGLGLNIASDEGDDSISLNGVLTLDDIEITTGTQNDSVVMSDVTSGKNIKVSFDSGTDLMDGTNVFAEYDAVFEGGDGFYSYIDGGIGGGEKTEIKEFEFFN